MTHPFEGLVAYQRAVEVADELYPLVAAWPYLERGVIGKQLLRAIESVAANIAESSGRWTAADRRHFLRMARGSLVEAEHWLKRAEKLGLIDASPRARLDEAGRALNGLIRRPTPSPGSGS